jgi:hypothetical protein
MYFGDSRPEDAAVDGVMAAIYQRLDDHVFDSDNPYDIDAGLEQLTERMHREREQSRLMAGAALPSRTSGLATELPSSEVSESVIEAGIRLSLVTNRRSYFFFGGILALAVMTICLLAFGHLPPPVAAAIAAVNGVVAAAGAWIHHSSAPAFRPGRSDSQAVTNIPRDASSATRAAETAQRARASLAARQEAERIWQDSPDRAGFGEYLRYMAVKSPLEHTADEAQRHLGQLSEQVDYHQSQYRDARLPSAGYRILVLTGLVSFLAVAVLGISLNYLIFRGLHPTGTMVVPLSQACLAVLGIAAGSVIMFGANRRHLLPPQMSSFFRRVVVVGGALLAACIAAYLTVIAPDRLSAGALAFSEIPLSEVAVLGVELLMLHFARYRRERARREHQQAQDAVQQADARFIAELTHILITHGHGEESVRKILTHAARFSASAMQRPDTAATPSPVRDPVDSGAAD